MEDIIIKFYSPYIKQYISWLWPFMIGYGYYICLQGIWIGKIMVALKNKIKFEAPDDTSKFTDKEKEAYGWYAKRVGNIDGIMYITAFLFGYREFVAVWLAFKLAGRWSSAEMELDLEKERIKEYSKNYQRIIHNAIYNIFTIGNALTIICATAGWKIICWLKGGLFYKAILIGSLVIIALMFLENLAKRQSLLLDKTIQNKKQ